MARKFRHDDSSTWGEKYGNGSDGVLIISTPTIDAPIDSSCFGTFGTSSLSATNTSFTTGQCILIHQTRGTNNGEYEFNVVKSYTSGTITTKYPLQNTYVTSGDNAAQVIVMKQYINATFTASLTPKSWNGTVGGIYAILCKGTITGANYINADAIGFRGGIGGGPGTGNATTGGPLGNGNHKGYSGEGNLKSSNIYVTGDAVDSGGNDGSWQYVACGGGNATTGGYTGPNGSENHEGAGMISGNVSLTNITFGGGGAGGGCDWPITETVQAPSGGNGGGIVLLIAKTINGCPTSNGGAGGSSSYTLAGAGGAGGSIILKGQNIFLGSLGTAIAGVGGTGQGPGAGSNGASGGLGRIHIAYLNTLNGSTVPSADVLLDRELADAPSAAYIT